MATIEGGAFGESLHGTSATDLIFGGGGNDVIFSGSGGDIVFGDKSEEHTSELQSLMRISYAVFCLKKKKNKQSTKTKARTEPRTAHSMYNTECLPRLQIQD